MTKKQFEALTAEAQHVVLVEEFEEAVASYAVLSAKVITSENVPLLRIAQRKLNRVKKRLLDQAAIIATQDH